MTKGRVLDILDGYIQGDGSLFSNGWYLSWVPGRPAILDGDFTCEELEAIVWWIRHVEALTTKTHT